VVDTATAGVTCLWLYIKCVYFVFYLFRLQCNDALFVLQLLRKSYSELKLLEAVNSSPADDSSLLNDSAHETSERQQELIEKVLKNVAITSEVL